MNKNEKKNETAVQDSRVKTKNYQKVSELLRSLLEVSVQVGTYDLDKAPAGIAAYQQRTEELLKLDMSMNKSDLKQRLVGGTAWIYRHCNRQEYVGSSFLNSTTSAYPVMGSYEMICSNVK